MNNLFFDNLNEITLLIKMLLLILLVQGLARYIPKLSSYWIAQSWLLCFLMVMLLPLISQWLPSIELKLLIPPVEQSLQFTLNNNFDSDQLLMIAKSTQTSYLNSITTIYTLVLTVFLLHYFYGLYRLRSISKQGAELKHPQIKQSLYRLSQQIGLRQVPTIRTSGQIKSPFTFGLLKPVIFLPKQLSRQNFKQKTQTVLLHELMHIRRNDWFWVQIMQLACIVFWFNPFLWLVRKKYMHAMEMACDEAVIQCGVKPSQYAETLIFFHGKTNDSKFIYATAMAKPSSLYVRLERVLNSNPRSKKMNIWQKTSIVFIIIISLIFITSSQISHAEQSVVPAPEQTPLPDDASMAIEPVVAPTPPAAPAIPQLPELGTSSGKWKLDSIQRAENALQKTQQQLKTTVEKLKSDQKFKLATAKEHMELARLKVIQAREKLKTNNDENILGLTEKTLSDEDIKMIQQKLEIARQQLEKDMFISKKYRKQIESQISRQLEISTEQITMAMEQAKQQLIDVAAELELAKIALQKRHKP